MIVGIPREIKPDEYRVAILPVGVELLTRAGHQVLVEQGAGLGSGYEDAQYLAAGAKMAPEHAPIFEKAELIVKVKEPLEGEFSLLQAGQVVFIYFHFAADRTLTETCLRLPT